MANPVLSDKIFNKSKEVSSSNGSVMTINGALNKTLILLIFAVLGAVVTWELFSKGSTMLMPLMWGGLIGGFILALIISFKPHLAPILSPAYAIAEGLALGGISAVYNNSFAETAPNIVISAVGLTLLVVFSMFIIQRTRIIKVTSKFKKVMVTAIMAIGLFYLITIVGSFFGMSTEYYTSSSPLSIGISVVITLVAAFSLLMDFQFIEDAARKGAPKFMEWYGAFGLMVTIVWLYIEVLRLLGKLAGRD